MIPVCKTLGVLPFISCENTPELSLNVMPHLYVPFSLMPVAPPVLPPYLSALSFNNPGSEGL